MIQMDFPVQDGADGHVLISSSKSFKITTNCWITIHRRMQDFTKKKEKNPHPKTKKKPQPNGRRTIMIKIKAHTLGGWPTKWKTIMPNKFSHYREDLEPHIRLPSLGMWQRDWESPGNLTLKARGIWLQGFHSTGRNRDSSPGGHRQNFVCTSTQKKEAVTPQETEQKLPAGVGGSSVKAWVSRGSPQGWGDWQQLSGKVAFGVKLLGVCH